MFFELAFAVATGLGPANLPPAQPFASPDLTRVDYILPAQRVVTYAPVSEVRRLSNVSLSPEAQAAFDSEFASAGFYGAFAISKDGGWGYAVASNSIEAARDIAMQECIRANNAQCVVLAELIPQGYVDIGPGDITVADEVAGHYNDTTTNLPAYATAVSGDGAYSKVWGMATQAEADAAALSDCESYRINDLPDLGTFACVLLPRPRK